MSTNGATNATARRSVRPRNTLWGPLRGFQTAEKGNIVVTDLTTDTFGLTTDR